MARPDRTEFGDEARGNGRPVDLDSRSQRGGRGPRSASESLQPERVQAPPVRHRAVRHPAFVAFSLLMTAIVIAILGVGGAAVYATLLFDRPGPLNETRSVLVARGASLDTVADQLVRSGAISNRWVFWAGARLSGHESSLKAGEFVIGPKASMREILESLVSGRALLYQVTIPEGLTSKQILARLRDNEFLDGELPQELPAEGGLFPDTYKFVRGDSRQSIIDRMRRERDRVVAEVWARRSANLPIKTANEMIVLASIVEKETAIADERSRVAGVFVNRLNKNMPLQSDPTAIYGIFGSDGKPAGWTPTGADMRHPSPYNTYMHGGLPPGPIANPGRAALEAAVNPSRTAELFFVADGNGGHAFAATLDEHNRNVDKLRAKTRGAVDAGPALEAIDKVAGTPKPAQAPLAFAPADGGGKPATTGSVTNAGGKAATTPANNKPASAATTGKTTPRNAPLPGGGLAVGGPATGNLNTQGFASPR